MGWSSIVVWIEVDQDNYFETRPDPDGDEEKFQARRHVVKVFEARGLNDAGKASALTEEAVYSNGTVRVTARRMVSGGWLCTKTTDFYYGGWVTGSGSPP